MAERGRPTLYKEEYADMLINYFSVEPYREKIKKVITKGGDVIEVPQDEANDFPTLAGFAIKIGVHRDTLHKWATDEDKPSFSDAYKRAKDFQENFLLTNGLKGLVHPAFAIFTAKNVIGFRDRFADEADQVNVTQTQTNPTETLSADALMELVKVARQK